MKRLNQWLALTSAVAGLTLCATQLPAQDQPGRGDRGRGGFDPEQMRQRMMERVKEQLEITKDDEWKAVEPLVQKVFDARRESMAAGMGGMMRGFGRGPRGGNPGDRPPGGNDQGNRPRFGPEPSAEEQALQKAIDSNASKDELKAAMAKCRESRKAKEAKVKEAQENLRKVLSLRQEAIAVSNGWMD